MFHLDHSPLLNIGGRCDRNWGGLLTYVKDMIRTLENKLSENKREKPFVALRKISSSMAATTSSSSATLFVSHVAKNTLKSNESLTLAY